MRLERTIQNYLPDNYLKLKEMVRSSLVVPVYLKACIDVSCITHVRRIRKGISPFYLVRS